MQQPDVSRQARQPRYRLNVLLAAPQADHYERVRGMLAGSRRVDYVVGWAPTAESALAAVQRNQHDVYVFEASMWDAQRLALDERVRQCHAPCIVLADGQRGSAAAGARQEDSVVSHAGLDLELLERSIRSAIDRSQSARLRADRDAQAQALLEAAAEAVITIDEQGIIGSFNPAAERIFGYRAEECIGREIGMLMPYCYQAEHGRYLADYLATGVRKLIGRGREVFGRHADGSTVPLHLAVSETRLAGRRVFTGVLRDLTQNKADENRLRESQRFLQGTLDALSSRIAILDETGRIIAVNEAWNRHAHPPASGRGAAGADYLQACQSAAECFSQGPLVAQGIREVMAYRRDEFHLEYLSPETGEKQWFTVRVTRFRGDGPLRIVVAHENITERRQAEESLAQLSRQNDLILNTVGEGIVGLDLAGRTTFVNPAAATITGWTIEELIRHPKHGFLHPGTAAAGSAPECPVCATLRDGLPRRSHSDVFWRRDGSSFPVEYSCQPTRQSDRIVGAVLTFKDVTQRKLLESQLLQAQKLESIGQLAAGIAHEINTPTQYIGDNTRFLLDAFTSLHGLLSQTSKLVAASRGRSCVEEHLAGTIEAAERADLEYLLKEIPLALEQSLEGVERVAGIVRAMKEFAHPDVPEKTAVDLNRAIQSTITVARNEWRFVADMVTDFDADLPLVSCLPGEINQVVLNLIVNASHAIADVVAAGKRTKGTIRVSTRRRGDWVEIHVADDGSGIAEEIRSKVFDPFFSTKEVGKGTGQGLMIAHSVVTEKHGGTIGFETQVGKGTTFIVRLPIGAADGMMTSDGVESALAEHEAGWLQERS